MDGSKGKSRKRLVDDDTCVYLIRELLQVGNAGNPKYVAGVKSRIMDKVKILEKDVEVKAWLTKNSHLLHVNFRQPLPPPPPPVGGCYARGGGGDYDIVVLALFVIACGAPLHLDD